MPPVNDNIANAITLTGLTGLTSGSNVGATVESGETGWPKNAVTPAIPPAIGSSYVAAQATVWYKWVCPAFPMLPSPPGFAPGYYEAPTEGEVIFRTDNPSATNFATVVQIFSAPSSGSPTVGDITECAYVLDERVGQNCGAANGAACSVIMTVGNTYYIRVGGRNGAQGVFGLAWAPFDRPTLGSCANCGPTSLGAQIGSLQIDVSAAYSENFPTVPAGFYEVSLCKGALIWGGSEPYWAVASGSSNPVITVTWPESSWTMPPYNFASEAQTEIANLCNNTGTFLTCGGAVNLSFVDGFYPDNIPGSASPTFQLVQVTFDFNANVVPNVGASFLQWFSSGNACTASFDVNCYFSAGINGVTVTLLNTGGVSGASAPQTVNLPGDSYINLGFTFSAPITTQLCTATLEFSVCGVVLGTIEYPLYPVVTLGEPVIYTSAACSPSGTRYEMLIPVTIVATNSWADGYCGNGYITLTGTSSPLSLVSNTSSCPVIASLSANFSSDIDFEPFILGGSSTTNNTLTVTPTWGTLTFPTITVPIVIP